MIHSADLPPQSGFVTDALRRLDRVTHDYVELLGNLGALIAIDIDGVGRLTFTSGHADLHKTQPVRPEHAYQIGSQSKTLAALVLVLLARDGQVGLDDTVVGYLDLPIDRRITIRHLLMNSSGLGEFFYGFGPRLDLRMAIAPRDIVALALPQGQIFEPGDRFDYCNTGWTIAAMLIEAVTGQRFGDVVAERILAPLALTDTGLGGHVPAAEPMRGYWTFSNEPEPVDMTAHLNWAFGAGDGISTASDILTIFKSLLKPDSALGISLNTLTAETAKPSADPYFPMSLGTEYGLGLERRSWAGRKVWGHPGSTYSTRSSTWIDAGCGVGVATCVTTVVPSGTLNDEFRYPRAQLFAMALNTAYALAAGAR